MRPFNILILAIILSHSLSAQDENRFKNFQGIKQSQNVDAFEAEGYDIFIEQVDIGLDEKGITKLKKKYSFKDARLIVDSVLNLNVLTATEQRGRVVVYFNYYLISVTAKTSTVIAFIRANARDIELEREFVTSHLSNSIPAYVYTDLEVDSIDFAGRTIILGPPCKWTWPHSIQCPDFGQMNWAIFDDLKKAEEYRDTHFELAKSKNITDVMEEERITLKFEGQETKALRTKIKIKIPKLVMGGSNVLVVYYVTAQVRGKYVTCILSQYTNDVNGDRLAPLLAEVLTLQNPDGTWPDDEATPMDEHEWNPTSDTTIVQNENRSDDRGFVRIEAGVWIPIGKLSSKVGISPNFGIHLPIITNPNLIFRLDCFLSVFIPQNTKEFEYSSSDSVFMTKIGAPSGVFGLLVTKTKNINNSSVIDYFDHTVGLGFGMYPTTTEKPKKNAEDKSTNYHFDTIHLSYGIVVRKKIFKTRSIGLALRYNFTPTNWFSSHVGSGFGSSSITTGLQIKI